MKKTILMLDDREIFLYIAKSHLAPRGYNVLLARDERQFLSLLAHRRVDMILLDVHLGPKGGEGITLLRWLRTMGRQVPIIMITSDNETRQECQKLGAAHFTTKPVNYEDLSRQLDRIFEVAVS